MSTVRVWAALLVAGAALGAASCKRQAAPVETDGGAAAPAAAAGAPRCTPADTSGSVYTIGSRSATEEEGFGLPFAVALGTAAAYEGGFAVGALNHDGGEAHALVATIAEDGSRGAMVDLGQVHGDVDPPRVTADGSELFVALSDSDAGGPMARLARISSAGGRGTVTWGASVPQGNDDSQAQALVAGAGRLLLAWDDWNRDSNHGVVRLAVFPQDDLAAEVTAVTLSPSGDDAEGPRLEVRRGGFWAAWISNGSIERSPLEHKGRAAGERAGTDTAERLVDLPRRWIQLLRLDAAGRPDGTPISVSPRTGSVLAFDLASRSGGGAVVVWREDNTSPGAPGGRVSAAVVGSDGSVERRVISEEDVGAGVPQVLMDRSAPSKGAAGWIAVGSAADATRIAALGSGGELLDALEEDPVLANAVPMALAGGRLLAGRPRGRAVELSVLKCAAALVARP